MKPLSLFLCVFGFLNQASATSFYIRPFSEFTQSAPNVARGVVHNVHAENAITAEGGKTIYTFAGFEIKEVLKGKISGSLITIRKIGGTKDGYTLEIPSSPEFKDGDELVLFLSEPKEDQSFEVVGLELGQFGLEEKNGETVLTGGIFTYSKPNPHESEHQRADNLSENQKEWSLSDLRKLIRSQEGQTPASSGESLPPSAASSSIADASADQKIDGSTQTETESTPNSPSVSYVRYGVISLVVLFVLGFFFYLRRR